MRIELIDLVLFTIYGHDEGNHKNDETYSGDPCSVAGGTEEVLRYEDGVGCYFLDIGKPRHLNFH
ncbi:unnamed protein product [Trifolium pratense]|uniref:Uncharacterized protein n=1 Tax=Trifolium pratense TaxID=57577 RepID=A0ACB0JAI6_TRIPR|nr:unnamed protein product [Trifolium pratense]